LVKRNLINLMDRWCLDIVRWSKTGYSVLYMSWPNIIHISKTNRSTEHM